MRQALSVQQVNAICARLLPIGDKIFEYKEQLRDGGFAAFVPYHEFLDSFCTCEKDQQLHRQCLIEGAKNRLGRPFPLRMIRAYGEHLYFSPFFQQLLDERDQQNGVPETQLSSRYPGELWRQEVDPCERRKTLREITERETYEVSWNHMLRRQRECFLLEAGRHATDLAAAFSFDQRGRYAFYTAAMERHASALGFQLNKKSSRPNYPVFSIQAAGDWELCWTMDSGGPAMEPDRRQAPTSPGRAEPASARPLRKRRTRRVLFYRISARRARIR